MCLPHVKYIGTRNTIYDIGLVRVSYSRRERCFKRQNIFSWVLCTSPFTTSLRHATASGKYVLSHSSHLQHRPIRGVVRAPSAKTRRPSSIGVSGCQPSAPASSTCRGLDTAGADPFELRLLRKLSLVPQNALIQLGADPKSGLSPRCIQMGLQNLFGGRSVACDFVDLAQNGFCIGDLRSPYPVAPLQGVI